MTAIRFDTTPWITGAVVFGVPGFGVLGSAVPSTGTSGPGYLYNDLSLPADAGKEVCGRITTWPSAGTLFAYEDSSFTFTAPDGSYTPEYQLYVDGVATGSPVAFTLAVGAAGIDLAAQASATTSASATLTTQIALQASNAAQTSASATLTTQIALQASNAAQTSARATLAAGAADLAASGSAQTSGSATLTTQITLQASGAAQAAASADLSSAVPPIDLSLSYTEYVARQPARAWTARQPPRAWTARH